MMKPIAFDFHRATSLEEALLWLDAHPEGKILAGGQSLIPMMNFRIARPQALIDINAVPDLNSVECDGLILRIGALVRHEELAQSEMVSKNCAVITKAAAEVGHWAIRNRGTLGGSLVHADPAAELPAAMVALQATFILQSPEGVRRVPAAEFFMGFLTTDIMHNEILVRVEIPLDPVAKVGFAEFARRPGDFALAGAFVVLAEDGTGAVTWFGVAGGPERREGRFPADENSRTQLFASLVETLDILDEGTYRAQLAVSVAELAYLNAIGGTKS